MRKPYSHGIILGNVRAALDKEPWEDDTENPGYQLRRLYLGTVFAWYPSGKFYTPFANSNVASCPVCKGDGSLPPHHKRRIVKKWARRHARVMRKFDAMRKPARRALNHAAACAWLQTQPKAFRMRGGVPRPSCDFCGGLGSREAHLDELWRESAEEALESIGCSLTSGEGDPCDLFVDESRDAPDEDGAEDDGDAL